MKRWAADPKMHVYHFGGYEETHFKLLAGKYATREEELDRMLRADVLVDLHTIFKQAVRAGVRGILAQEIGNLPQIQANDSAGGVARGDALHRALAGAGARR